MSGVLAVLGLGCRLGLAGGAVWGTHQLGLWGDAKQGEKVYHQARSGELKAAVLADCPVTEYLPELPDTGVALQLEAVSEAVGEARGNFWGHYNSAVMTSIQGLINLPQTAGNYVSQAVEAVQEMTK